jgi:Ca-activated chloride channel homolog
MAYNMVSSVASSSPSIGFSAGGAKDVNSLQENILLNYLPLPSDVTYEGLFYYYHFDRLRAE